MLQQPPIEQTSHYQLRHQVRQIAQAEEEVDLGNGLLQFLAIALHQTTDGHQCP